MWRTTFIILFLFISIVVLSQDNVNPNGFNRFYHENGIVSSEGNMRDGKPDAYWKTFNTEGILVSEGNRKNFELDSLWKFYNDEEILILEINYLAGKKNGLRRTFHEDEILEENFINDVKEGLSYYLFKDKKSYNY